MARDDFFSLSMEQYAEAYAASIVAQQGDPDERQVELEVHYLKLMKSAAGRAVIEDLVRRFLMPATFDANLGALNGAAMGFVRQGQQDVVGHIIGMAELARKRGTDG